MCVFVSSQASFPISLTRSLATDEYNPVMALFHSWSYFYYLMRHDLTAICVQVSLRQKSKKKSCVGMNPLFIHKHMFFFHNRISASGMTVCVDLCSVVSRMSRRRVSVRDLDPVDFQGWLYRKKEGKGFLSIKWKKYWFVLKKTSLYWYTNQTVSLLNALSINTV